MKSAVHPWLVRLGAGERIPDICAAGGVSRSQFDAWWRAECQRRVPTGQPPTTGIELRRDPRGIPHVRAANERDLFFGYGYAVAQDRLFQLDYLRRKASGRLAEVLGPTGVESDVLYRTFDLRGVAQREWTTLPADVQTLLQAYSDGVNALMEQTTDNPPIEFDLLEHRPEAWSPIDSLVILGEFRWYLTVRFPVIVIPELVKRALGDGPHYRDFIVGEADEESILQRGEYQTRPFSREGSASDPSASGDDNSGGSNNWVLAGSRTVSGKPLVASDPHVPFYAVSIWHEVVLNGGSFHVGGVTLAGVPGVMIGRNRRVAWGITNNICSLRDLYLERTDANHPGCFLYEGRWEPEAKRDEVIRVRGAADVIKTVRSSRNGPIVTEILPTPARGFGPTSLRWTGFEPCGWLTSILCSNRANSCAEFRESLCPWSAPTFNLVFADIDGHTGFQTVGRIPLRSVAERGIRPGWDPMHQWTGFIPFDELPHLVDPQRGYVVTANNRVASPDFPYPMAGAWNSGHRARRIREQIEAKAKWSSEDCRRLQLDTRSGRAVAAVAPLLALLQGEIDPRVKRAITILKEWDCRIDAGSAGAAIFNVFFAHWCKAVMRERIPDQADFMAANAGGLALRLLSSDPQGWFQRDRAAVARETINRALDELTSRLGPDTATWSWGAIHPLTQKHFLSGRGDLGELLDRSGLPCPGDATTVLSGSPDANHAAWLGAGYRMVVDLAEADMRAVEVAGVSGHPGSPHYDDRIDAWSRGELFSQSLE